ncbi:MAG TPA: TRIC cation channel family protein [Steroidobacteraceae bacterium]|nr:TRIC cation channel family protein [Steroidobacteraceae bacterium]
MNAAELLFLLGTAVFAVTGVLAAARQNMDVMSFVIIGVVTAIGGGTLRDLMLDQPLFWLAQPAYLSVAAGAALATFFFERRFRATLRGFLYLDAIATALYTVLAIEKTLRLGFSAGVAVIMGVITGIGGGVIRDLMTGQPTILMRRELYMTPILLGGVFYIALRATNWLEPAYVSALAMLAIAGMRLGAIRWGWAFPDWLTYRPLR